MADDILFVLTVESSCPLSCSYCLMEFSDDERQHAPSTIKRQVIDRVAIALETLSRDKDQKLGLSLCNGEPLLQLNMAKRLLANIDDCSHIRYELISSYRFDEKHNYHSVFRLLDDWVEYFKTKKISYYLKWSIHLEYYDGSKDIVDHYNALKNYNIDMIPVMILNRKKDVHMFNLLKKIIPELEYQLTINEQEKNTLIQTLTPYEINILKSVKYTVNDKHIVDRVMMDDWSFTGLTCGYPGAEINDSYSIVNVSSNGQVGRCSKEFMYPGEEKHYTGNILDMTHEQLIDYANTKVVCPYDKCNLCASTCVGLESDGI